MIIMLHFVSGKSGSDGPVRRKTAEVHRSEVCINEAIVIFYHYYSGIR